MKKKLLSIMLVMVMVLGMSTTAFAEVTTPVSNPTKDASVAFTDASKTTNTITMYKDYFATNANTTSPAETFSFSIVNTNLTNVGVDATTGEAKYTVTSMPTPSIAPIEVVAGIADQDTTTKLPIVITLPSYDVVGIYTYTITENNNHVAGVTYHANDVKLVVTVTQGATSKELVATVHCETTLATDESEKDDTIENVYSAGTLAVKKIVSGNLGDQTKDFKVTVTFTAPTYVDENSETQYKPVNETISYDADHDGVISDSEKILPTAWTNGSTSVDIYVNHNETITFTNIPYGVTYSVSEETLNDYDATYSLNGGTATENAVENEELNTSAENVEITNNKEADVDTGIIVNNLPYILILGAVVLSAVVIIRRKRYSAM